MLVALCKLEYSKNIISCSTLHAEYKFYQNSKNGKAIADSVITIYIYNCCYSFRIHSILPILNVLTSIDLHYNSEFVS